MRRRLEQLSKSLRDRDKTVCGDAPPWIVEFVADGLDKMLGQVTGDIDAETAKLIARSAVKSVLDCPVRAEDCNGILDALAAFGTRET
jgi:hypothetical protein